MTHHCRTEDRAESRSEIMGYLSIHRATYGVVHVTQTQDNYVMESDSECCSNMIIKGLGMKGTVFLGNDCAK